MLYDLNIAWSPSTSTAELERTLRFSAALGYNVVALNHTITPPVPPQIANPLPKFPPPSAGPASSSSSSSSTTPDQTSNKQPKLPTVLHRATLVLNDPSAYHRLPQLGSSYDIVAVRPTTEREFQGACLNLNLTDASLISLDLAQRFPFHFRPRPCMAAVNRGLRFEVCYAQGLSPGPGSDAVNDARARAAFIGNVVELVRATRGRGIVISSGARGALGLRAPADVVNLLALWGLGSEKGMEGLGVLPRGVVVNEGIKRSGFRGVVNIVGVAEREKGEGEDREAAKEKQKEAAKNNNKNKDGDNKRKVAEEEGGGDGGPEGADSKPMSKRQAKRIKAAIRRAQNTEAKTT
ncbi:hypothetical protein DL769_007787 [Monosporascus sp. CRB-8-3]|nr:hypothetical protein DL769_007787 [Monosporascus sp. CRB-8-3]